MDVKTPYDFSGYATKFGIKCDDGRTIRKGAFRHQDGAKIPLVYMHVHDDPTNVIGHAILENRDDGVYAYAYLNAGEKAVASKELVLHGDINAFSIYANKLQKRGSEVIHGVIREVSLVLAGANSEALIDDFSIAHGANEDGDEAVIYHGTADLIVPDDNESETPPEEGSKKPEPEEVVQHAASTKSMTVQEIVDSMTEEQRTVLYAMVGTALEEGGTVQQSAIDNDEGGSMKHNVFEQGEEKKEVLTHDAMKEIIDQIPRYGSLKESIIQHGITDMELLFPEFKDATGNNGAPTFISREMGWVNTVLTRVHRTPFSRIKSTFADITEDEARAKGYIKGAQKKDEVFSILRRTTTPTMIYKRQKFDRQDMLEIIDFDFLGWLFREMDMMLREELARAVLVGDGRLASSEDKIPETNIRPIWTDEDLFTIKALVDTTTATTPELVAKAFRAAVIKSRSEYKGSGNPTLYLSEGALADLLLLDDGIGRPLYATEEQLRAALRVSNIVTVPILENLTRQTAGGASRKLEGIIVNLQDYNIGTNRGGEITRFDDFDIDHNKMTYLIETYVSGAMIRPYSAIAIESGAPETEPSPVG